MLVQKITEKILNKNINDILIESFNDLNNTEKIEVWNKILDSKSAVLFNQRISFFFAENVNFLNVVKSPGELLLELLSHKMSWVSYQGKVHIIINKMCEDSNIHLNFDVEKMEYIFNFPFIELKMKDIIFNKVKNNYSSDNIFYLLTKTNKEIIYHHIYSDLKIFDSEYLPQIQKSTIQQANFFRKSYLLLEDEEKLNLILHEFKKNINDFDYYILMSETLNSKNLMKVKNVDSYFNYEDFFEKITTTKQLPKDNKIIGRISRVKNNLGKKYTPEILEWVLNKKMNKEIYNIIIFNSAIKNERNIDIILKEIEKVEPSLLIAIINYYVKSNKVLVNKIYHYLFENSSSNYLADFDNQYSNFLNGKPLDLNSIFVNKLVSKFESNVEELKSDYLYIKLNVNLNKNENKSSLRKKI